MAIGQIAALSVLDQLRVSPWMMSSWWRTFSSLLSLMLVVSWIASVFVFQRICLEVEMLGLRRSTESTGGALL